MDTGGGGIILARLLFKRSNLTEGAGKTEGGRRRDGRREGTQMDCLQKGHGATGMLYISSVSCPRFPLARKGQDLYSVRVRVPT